MARTEGDTWDLANSVGATATMVAAARAAASRRPQPVITDQYAEPLVRAVGLDVFTRLAVGDIDSEEIERSVGFPRMVDTFAARARFFDDYFAEATRAGVRQVVIVASGLDARAYRLAWPAGTTVYEIDQPEVIAFKAATLADLGAAPTATLQTVGIDLREDWPAALQEYGFDPAQPTAWLAEGVLIGWLPPEAEVRLLDSVIPLSAEGSRLAADYGTVTGNSEVAREQARSMTEGWRRHGLEMDLTSLTFPGERTDVAAYLNENGWDTTGLGLADLFSAAGLADLGDAEHQVPATTIHFVKAVRP
ncbi:SAM-dependent methyltransferase [Mycobacterium parmense]|uniref:S-adenosyl-L-methionine-dependent methyltransferase n=1 Tax=Mycobacterium parmense TaxID=185642 RepID=A0A7I7Z377_9MYCO|nr:SAM-dependent methyltransferase [Mycobacterium parmense]MCV7352160.1 SAM-dependent methyltransferase [Mycobacterium parmense]ORW56148.1 SAM-dependent methyltransferase [Mycobacterium parmense]BBZ48122.1 putative S-adenosyl-L-methionine-dependent methyltransferase [Mycobacterium parmense]